MDDRYPDANLNLGATFLKLGQGDSAESYFLKELYYYPDNAKALNNLASLYYLQNQYEKARDHAQKALKIKPYLADLYLISIRIAGALKDTLLLENKISQSQSQIVGSRAALFYEAGVVYSNWKNYGRAIELLTMAVEEPEPPIETDDRAFSYSYKSSYKAKAAYQLGYIYGITRQLELSIIMSENAISLDSNLYEAYVNLANAYIIQGHRIRARELLEDARAKFPDMEI